MPSTDQILEKFDEISAIPRGTKNEASRISAVETLTALAYGTHLPWRAVPGSVALLKESRLGA